MNASTTQQLAWGISVGSMHWSTFGSQRNGHLDPVSKCRSKRHIPAAVLLSRLSGEPLRLDYWLPPHPRGSGSEWPLEAVVSRDCGSGRFPLAAAWTGRVGDRNWPWRIDGEHRELSSLEAIASGITQLAKIHARESPCAIVIPNDFRQREQQKLLDICTFAGVNASLLWLPVAATLAWLEKYRDSLPSPGHSAIDRLSLPIVHADWGIIRCSTLHLVKHKDNLGVRWIPARRRPMVSDWSIAGFGWDELSSCHSVDESSVWRRQFVSAPRSETRQEFRQVESPKAVAALATENVNSNILAQIAQWTIEQSTRHRVDSNLAQHLALIENPASAIFVGDFAESVSTGHAVARFLRTTSNLRTSIPPAVWDGIRGENMLAKGASIFSRDRIEGRTSYLDTLPTLELFVDRNHQYDWLNLLGDGDQVVPGGEEWELQKPIEGLALRLGATSIKLVVAHEEYSGVRELQVTLDRPAEQRLGAKLHVSATPAQGNAKLKLITEAHAEIPSRSILANWDRMQPVLDHEARPVDKERFLKMQPRAYPELFPRRWSHTKWRIALPTVEEIIHRVQEESPEAIIKNERSMNSLKDKLLAKDQSQTPYDATAIGSDFKAPFDQKSLDSLAKSLLSLWKACKHRKLLSVSTVVRALGYISVEDSEFDNWLSDNLTNHFQDRQAVLHTAGLAMRSPECIAKLFEFVFFRNNNIVTPGANELKAISQVLRYRTDATKEISSRKCEQVIQSCLGIFERGMERGGGGYPFRWASLIIVYMLRRRMFDLDFLDPDDELATLAKELFRTAIDHHKQRRLRPMGGSVDLPAALQQMINYIDRKGSGDILMAGE